MQGIYEGISVLRYLVLFLYFHVFFSLLLFLSMVLSTFILTVATAFHSASVLISGGSIFQWIGNYVAAIFMPNSHLLCVCWWSVYLFICIFSVSFLLKSCVNMCCSICRLAMHVLLLLRSNWSFWLYRADAHFWCIKYIIDLATISWAVERF